MYFFNHGLLNLLKLRRLLCTLLDCMGGTTMEKAARIDGAIRKAAATRPIWRRA